MEMSDPDPVELLRSLAKQYRVRVVKENLHDPAVAASEVEWRTWNEQPPPPDRFRHQVKLKIDGRRFAVRANDRYVVVTTRDVRSCVVFAINRPDPVLRLTHRLPRALGSKKLAVYVGDGLASLPVLDQPEVLRCIENLELGREESLHVAGNGLTVYLRPRSTQRIVDVLNQVGPLIDQLPEPGMPSEDFGDLPTEFGHLIPLMKSWARSDDAERSDMLARASNARLARLVNQVEPHFASINTYLDSLRDGALPECAATLGTLTECATEAQLLLARRRK
jgi:hypothetical protein